MPTARITKVIFYQDKFDNLFYSAGKEVLEELGDQFDRQLKEARREYPPDRITIREYGRGVTGKIAGTPRDVVDSGDLVDSYEIDYREDGATYSWTIYYALLVFLGWSSNTGVLVPPYPWTDLTILRMNFIKLWRSVLTK